MGAPTASKATVMLNLGPASNFNINSIFLSEVIDVVWDEAIQNHIDPVVVISQCMKETGWFNFKGKVPATYYNPCGLKKPNSSGDKTEDHFQFKSWSDGFRGMCQHLWGYAVKGMPPYTKPIVDPRWEYVKPGSEKNGVAPTLPQLGGHWAPSPTYGKEVEAIWRLLIK